MKYDYVIVGSGLFGSVFAYHARKAGNRVLVLDKRQQAGGNIYCESVNGINVHKYGAHIFHTDSREVWNFVNSFVPFNRYTNCPVASYKGKLYNLPFNMNTFYGLWGVTSPEEAKRVIDGQRSEALAKLKGREPQNLEEQALCLVGTDIYEKLIKGYTEKQWGRNCTDLPAFIIKRLPLRFTFDNNYFNDAFQGIPVGGYNKITEALLDGVDVHLGCDFFADRQKYETLGRNLVYTGALDEYYNYSFGKLAYRTVRFEHQELDVQNWQGNAVINYTERDIPYTRIIEHKHFEPESPTYNTPFTVISREYSCEWTEGAEPFYPVNDVLNTELSSKYKALAAKESHVIFGGRLADYRYYDMDDVILNAMTLCGKLFS